MALLLMLIERKDCITSRLSELEVLREEAEQNLVYKQPEAQPQNKSEAEEL